MLKLVFIGWTLLLLTTAMKRWLFLSRMKRAGRWLSWKVVTEKLRAGQGYLILNYGTSNGFCWWVESLPDSMSLEEVLWENAYLTSCPIRLMSLSRLSKMFPQRVQTTNERSFSCLNLHFRPSLAGMLRLSAQAEEDADEGLNLRRVGGAG